MGCHICEKCRKGGATVHITEMGEGRRLVEKHLCERCAQEEAGRTAGPDELFPAGGARRKVIMMSGEEVRAEHPTCDLCGRRTATVQVSEIIDGVVLSSAHLCKRCAQKKHGEVLRAASENVVTFAEQVRAAIVASAEVKRLFAEQAAADIARAVEIVATSLGNGGKVLLCGNGGSAAEAQHIAGEFVGRFRLERRALAAVALTTDTSILTSIANDYSFDDVFARQVEGLGREGDVLFAYSTSGNSRNVLKAVEKAKGLGMATIGFTGEDGGAMATLCDVCIKAPSTDTPTVQECHTAAGHTICRFAEEILCGGDR